MSENDASALRDALNDQLERVLDHYWPGWMHKGAIAYPAANSHRDLGSFEVHLSDRGKHQRGTWFRNSEGVGGDELNLFAYGETGQVKCNAEVFRAVRRFLGVGPRVEQAAERKQAAQERVEAHQEAAAETAADRSRKAQKIWDGGLEIDETHGERYLIARGLSKPVTGWPSVLRFLPRIPYLLESSLRFPAIVARVDDPADELIAIWLIYLDETEPTKAPVDKPKIGYGPAKGGAVRLGGPGATIGIAEGLETAMAAAELYGHVWPVWAALSTSGMISFEPPPEVERVMLFPDGDRAYRFDKKTNQHIQVVPPGEAAANRLHERLEGIGIKSVIQPFPHRPSEKMDYLDALNQLKTSAFFSGAA